MKNLTIALLSAVLASCAMHRGPGAMPRVAAPPLGQPVQPAVHSISTPIQKSSQLATAAREQIAGLRAELTEANRTAAEFRREVAQQREKGMDTKAELDVVWKELNRVQARNLFLEQTTVPKLAQTNASLEASLAIATEAVSAAEALAAKRDAEATLTHTQLEEANRVNLEVNKSVTALQAELQESNRKAARNGVYRNLVWCCIGTFILYVAAREIIPRLIRPF